MKIFTINLNTNLSKEISNKLEINKNLVIEKFKDGELLPKFTTSIRNEEVYLISQIKTSDDIIATCLTLDAAKRCGVGKMNLVLPYMPYSRQDKLGDHIRSSIGAKMISDLFQSIGINQVISIDLHNDSIPGFFNCSFIHLNGNRIFKDYIKNLDIEDLCFVSPDQGAIKKNIDFSKSFPDSCLSVINKKRVKPNEIHSMELIGDVKDKNIIMVDDLIDTGHTLKKASILLKENGAKTIRAISTHGVLSGNAIENIETSELDELIISDTIDFNKKCDKIKVISSSEIIFKVIFNLSIKRSLAETDLINGSVSN